MFVEPTTPWSVSDKPEELFVHEYRAQELVPSTVRNASAARGEL
jgi:hypothetical protein